MGRGAARRPAGAPPPEHPPAAAVPPQHRLQPDHHQVPAPLGADAPDHDPEEPIAPAEPRARPGGQRDGQVLPEEQVLHQERVAVVEQHAQDAQQQPAPFQHGRSLPHLHLPELADGRLASYGSPGAPGPGPRPPRCRRGAGNRRRPGIGTVPRGISAPPTRARGGNGENSPPPPGAEGVPAPDAVRLRCRTEPGSPSPGTTPLNARAPRCRKRAAPGGEASLQGAARELHLLSDRAPSGQRTAGARRTRSWTGTMRHASRGSRATGARASHAGTPGAVSRPGTAPPVPASGAARATVAFRSRTSPGAGRADNEGRVLRSSGSKPAGRILRPVTGEGIGPAARRAPPVRGWRCRGVRASRHGARVRAQRGRRAAQAGGAASGGGPP